MLTDVGVALRAKLQLTGEEVEQPGSNAPIGQCKGPKLDYGRVMNCILHLLQTAWADGTRQQTTDTTTPVSTLSRVLVGAVDGSLGYLRLGAARPPKTGTAPLNIPSSNAETFHQD